MAKAKPILPASYIDKAGCKVVYYRPKPDNHKNHVYINEDDNTYIYHCIIRLISEIGEKQYILPQFFQQFLAKDKQFSISSYNAGKNSPKPNSVFSYASGLVSNWLRNPAQDFTVKQLPKIEILTLIIHNLYAGEHLELGYNVSTGVKNKLPHAIKFVEA
jgi:hypothetical protein